MGLPRIGQAYSTTAQGVTPSGLYTPATIVVAPVGYVHKADYYCDGIADEVQIQTAINAVNALDGGSIYIVRGIYDITKTITIPSNIIIFGDGIKTLLKANASLNGLSNILVNSDLTGGNTNIHVTNIAIDGNQANRSGKVLGHDGEGHNIFYGRVSYSSIYNIVTYNGAQACLSLGAGTNNCIVEKNYIYNSWNHNLLVAGNRVPEEVTQNIIRGNIVYGAGQGGSQGVGIELANYATKNTIIGNISKSNLEGGIHVYYYSTNNTILGNILISNQQNGISIVDQSDYTQVSDNIIYSSNKIGIDATTSSLTYGGKYCTITNNVITNCGWNAIRGNASGDLSYSVIANNITDNCGILAPSGNGQEGMYFNTAIQLLIEHNQVTNPTRRGIFADTPTALKISNNNIQSTPATGIYISSTTAVTDTKITDNIITNCAGGVVIDKNGVRCDISNNKISGSTGTNSGILLQGLSKSKVCGNISSANGKHGIEVINDAASVGCTYNIISGNTCTLNTQRGINETGNSDYNIILGNDLVGNTGLSLSYVGANDEIGHNETDDNRKIHTSFNSPGFVFVGDNNDPLNTTAGDLTSIRLNIGNTATFGAATGELGIFTGNISDTASGAASALLYQPTINPSSNSSSEFRTSNFDLIVKPSTGVTLSTVDNIFATNRIRGNGLITTLNGIVSNPMRVDGSSASTAQITNVTGFSVTIHARTSGSTTSTIASAIGYDTSLLGTASAGLTVTDLIGFRMTNPLSGNTITDLIGFDIQSLTRGSTLNIGLRIAAPSGASSNYALQLSDTGATTAGGITFGTDTNVYRSAANVLTFNSVKLSGLVDPSSAQDAATKNYVDAVAQGLSVKPSAIVATTTTLPTYAYLSGVITMVATGVVAVDGHNLALNDIVLVKDETAGNAPYNGLYTVTTAGAVGVALVLTRHTSMDAGTEFPGAFVFIESGTVNTAAGFVCTNSSTPTVGVTNISFTQFSGAGEITAGAGLTKTANTIDAVGTANRILVNADSIDIDSAYVGQSSITTLGTIATGTWGATTIAVNKGGTGQTSYTDGQLLIGNSSGNTLAKTTLTGTSNQITVTNGGGSITLSTPQNIDSGASPTFSGLNLGTGAINTVGNIEVDGSVSRDITVARTSGTTGFGLTVQAGGAVSGGNNTAGGNLTLASGISTGSSSSAIIFATAAAGGSGTSDRTPSGQAVLFSRSSGAPVFSIGQATNTTTGLPSTSTNIFAISGQSAGGLVAYRNTTAATAGNNMIIQASGAVSGGTDLAGGTLQLNPGLSTGTGRSLVSIRGLTPATSTGTSDNSTFLDRQVVGAFKALTNNSAINIVNCTLASNTIVGGIIRYTIEVFDGTNLQMETGEYMFQSANKGGVFSGNTMTAIGTPKQFLGSGTLGTAGACVWAITGANPAVISVNANSSLTPSTGYPRITYSIENFTQQAIAIQ
jgi:parallel beta-helix repeat protein